MANVLSAKEHLMYYLGICLVFKKCETLTL